MEVLALIPARGGSKGIPRKNLRLLGGKPLVAHSIAHALAAQRITRTIVSTDDEEIAAVARAAGAEVPFLRPNEISGDLATDLEAVVHALDWLREAEAYEPVLVVHLRPTDPFRDPRVLDRAVETLAATPEADSLRAVEPARQSPYKMWRERDGYLEPLLALDGVAEPYNQPRQALPDVWAQSGYVDVVRVASLRATGTLSGRRILAFAVEPVGVDIDAEDDLAAAERLLSERAAAEGV